jgi:hypothetical protein
MTSHIEIVSVTYRRGKEGERQEWDFDDWQINKPDPDDWPDDLQGYDWRDKPIAPQHIMETRLGGVYIDLPSDWFGMCFGFIGQLFEGQESGLHWESKDGCTEEVFGGWADELKTIGDELLDAEIDRLRTKASRNDMWESVSDDGVPREVTFLTAWRYNAGRSYYDGEYESDWALLGRLDLSKIETLIVPTTVEVVK